MIDKIIETLLKFSNTLWMLLCVLLFAMTGSFEGMLLCGIFAFIIFVLELGSLLATKRRRHKGQHHGNQKTT